MKNKIQAFLRGLDPLKFTMVTVSALMYSLAMNIFVKSGNLFPGGYVGIARLLSMLAGDVLHLPLLSFSVIYFALNIVTTVFVWHRLGHRFVSYSILWYSLTSLFTAVIPIYEITSDILLIAVFGGILSGTAIGIALRANASSGGMDFIAIDLAARLHRPVWNYIFILNSIVLAIAGMLYGWDRALYSIIFQYASTQMVNTLHQRYKITNIQVVTDHPEAICADVFRICHHGITKIDCAGAYSGKGHTMLMMAIDSDQVKDVLKCIRTTDPASFITLNHVERIVGNFHEEPLE